MTLPTLTVEIDLRCDAGVCVLCCGHGESMCERCKGTGQEMPRDRRLMARVRQENSEGFTYGVCLLDPRKVFNVSEAMSIATRKLSHYRSPVNFVLDQRLQKIGVAA